MSGDPKVKIRVEADGKKAVEALDKVEKELDEVAASASKAGEQGAAGMETFTDAAGRVRDASGRFVKTAQDGGKALGGMGEKAGKAGEKLGGMGEKAGKAGEKLGGAGGKADKAGQSFTDLRSAIAALGLAALTRQFVEINSQIEAQAKALESVLGSQQAAAETMDYTAGLADRLGQSAVALTEQYVQLAAATKGTALEGQATRDVFEAVVGAMARLGKSSAETERALVAVSQMASKGVVSAEEMRQQLGEALPGAMQALSNATGIAVADLNEMMESGQLLAADVLPALAQGLNEAFGLDQVERVENLNASVSRLENALNRAFTEPGQQGLSQAFSDIIDVATVGIDRLSSGVVATGKEIGALAAYAGGAIPSLRELGQEISAIEQARRDYLDGLAESNAGLAAANAGASASLRQLSSDSLQAAQSYSAASAAADLTVKVVQEQGQAAIAAAQANVLLAQAGGDAAAVLAAEAQAAQTAADAASKTLKARQQALRVTTDYIDTIREQIATLEAQKTAEGANVENIDANIAAREKQIAALQKIADKQQAAADKAQGLADKESQAAANARLAAETYGDQSAALGELETALAAARAELEQIVAAQTAAAATLQELGPAQERLAEATAKYQQAVKDAAAGNQKAAEAVQSYMEEVRAAQAEVDRLTGLMEKGADADRRAAEAKRKVVEAQKKVDDAIGDLIKRKEEEVRAAERNTRAIKQEGQQRVEHLQNLAEEARARGDNAAAARFEAQALEVQGALLRNLAKAKADEVEAAEAALAAKLKDKDATAEQIAQAEESVATKKREAAAAQEAARHHEAHAAAQRQAAKAAKEGGEASDEAADATEKLGDAAESAGGGINSLSQIIKEVMIHEIGKIASVSQEAADAINEIYSSFDNWFGKMNRISQLDASAFINTDSVARARAEIAELEEQAREAAREAGELASEINNVNHAFSDLGPLTEMQVVLNNLRADLLRAEAAAKRLALAKQELADELNDLNYRFDSGRMKIGDYIAALEGLRGQYNKLSDRELRAVDQALRRAREQQEQFIRSAEDGLLSLEQRWASLNGQKLEALELQQELERLKLEQKLLDAQARGDEREIALLQKQLSLLDRIHGKERQLLREDVARQKEALGERANDEQRHHAERMASLADDLEAAQKANDKERIARIKRQMADEERRHKRAMRDIAEEREALGDALAGSGGAEDPNRNPPPEQPPPERDGVGGGPYRPDPPYDRAPPPRQPAPQPPITINIQGILDVNDRVTLENLSRKLRPVFADLDRRAA